MDVLKVDILYSLEVSLDILAMVGTSILLATTLQVKTGAQVGGGDDMLRGDEKVGHGVGVTLMDSVEYI